MWHPTSLQGLLQNEIVKPGLIAADGYKIFVGLVKMCNGKVCYLSSRLRGVAQTRRYEILPIVRNYPSASGHFTIASKETRLTDFGDLLQANK